MGVGENVGDETKGHCWAGGGREVMAGETVRGGTAARKATQKLHINMHMGRSRVRMMRRITGGREVGGGGCGGGGGGGGGVKKMKKIG